MNKIKEWILDNKGKTISLIIAFLYLTLSYWTGDLLRTTAYLIFVLGCIWFGEEIGAYTGFIKIGFPLKPTPGPFIVFTGWILLLLPVLIGVIRLIYLKG
jgi:hypothetical protein